MKSSTYFLVFIFVFGLLFFPNISSSQGNNQSKQDEPAIEIDIDLSLPIPNKPRTCLSEIYLSKSFQEEAPNEIKRYFSKNLTRPIHEREIHYACQRQADYMGYFVQIFGNKKDYLKYCVLAQPVRDPRWAPGVIAIFEAEKYKNSKGDFEETLVFKTMNKTGRIKTMKFERSFVAEKGGFTRVE